MLGTWAVAFLAKSDTVNGVFFCPHEERLRTRSSQRELWISIDDWTDATNFKEKNQIVRGRDRGSKTLSASSRSLLDAPLAVDEDGMMRTATTRATAARVENESGILARVENESVEVHEYRDCVSLLYIQAGGILIVMAWTAVMTWVIMKVIFRYFPPDIDIYTELKGLDLIQIGEIAYQKEENYMHLSYKMYDACKSGTITLSALA